MQLKPAAQSDWLIPCAGLRVNMKPVSTPVLVEARHIFRQLSLPELPQIDGRPDPSARLPAYRTHYLMTVAMVAAGALEWDGLEDEAAAPLPHPTPEQVQQLLDAEPSIFEYFDASYCTPLYLLMAEKKGSPPSASGISQTAAPATAKDATGDTATPRIPAPTTKTHPKPDKVV